MFAQDSLADAYQIQDYLYISNDPEENADNFDPKWALYREMNTDKERYQAIRKRWGNDNIPDPQVNLTYRQMKTQHKSAGKENSTNPSSASKSNSVCHITNDAKKKRQVSRRRSRSCTRPYEQLITNFERNFELEYSQLKFKHKAELQEMLQFQCMQLQALNDSYSFGNEGKQILQTHQEQQVFCLLSNQYQEVQCFLGEKNEDLVAYKKYMEEIKAFFTFYQKINDDEVTLQMTDEQYEHTVETERMYSLYSKFYR